MTPEHEKETVAGAIRTDFILSAEIMVIALKEVVDSSPDAGFVAPRRDPDRGRPLHHPRRLRLRGRCW